MKRLLLLPVLLGFAIVLAGMYSAIHNQVSYTVAPDYFHAFKFKQFNISAEWQTRLGASWVGWQASWWMGLFIGLPVFIASLFMPAARQQAQVFLKAASLVVVCALIIGIGALIHAYLTIAPEDVPGWALSWEPEDPLAMARAGAMHNASYLGGAIGLLCALGYTVWSVIRVRRRA